MTPLITLNLIRLLFLYLYRKVWVQALIADDRSLIERLVRFAQAHELLKKNAERAQKLVQESSVALETYQKQVKELEDRNMYLASGQAELWVLQAKIFPPN